MNVKQYSDFEALWAKANAAGIAAGQGCQPAPMVVRQGDITVNGQNVLSRDYFVADGVCGFAWIVVNPGTSPFAKFAKKYKGARAEYGGGTCVKWVGEFNQSMAKKEAYARAFAGVLKEAGINASARSRID